MTLHTSLTRYALNFPSPPPFEGAHLLQEIAVQFSSQVEQEGIGKELNNLLLLLSHLYNFKVGLTTTHTHMRAHMRTPAGLTEPAQNVHVQHAYLLPPVY